jgi:hypothetical protein
MSTASDILRACILRCAAAADERGRWRPEEACAAELWALAPTRHPFGPSEIDKDCAAAARRIGAWLAGRCLR